MSSVFWDTSEYPLTDMGFELSYVDDPKAHQDSLEYIVIPDSCLG